jgi:hypothetical protein
LLSIIYTYRNRDLERIKISFNSLKKQSLKDFQVFFVDYGSPKHVSKKAENLCNEYDFVNYKYLPTQFQPWNKSKALNSVIKYLESDYFFVADIDLVFHSKFVQKLKDFQDPNTILYFCVSYLPKGYRIGTNFDLNPVKSRNSTSEATGLTLFPVSAVKKIRGFNELYHFWGSEDTDIHVRLQNSGYSVKYYDNEVLMCHQWHESYHNQDSSKLTRIPRVEGIIGFNQQHLRYTRANNKTLVNCKNWGECIKMKDVELLEKSPVDLFLSNKKQEIDHYLYGLLPELKGVLKVVIQKDPFQRSFKYKLKNKIGKKVPHYYSLKEVNDLILIHFTSLYHKFPYSYKVSKDLYSIEVAIKKD